MTGDCLSLLPLLPIPVREALVRRNTSEPLAGLDEIRLRLHRCASLTVGDKNIRLSYVMREEERDALLSRLCRGSVYAYRESIKNGYIDLSGGVRVGLCGRALYEGGGFTSVVDISGFSFRIPHAVKGIGEEAYRAFLSLARGEGLLVYSPPNGGKTTLLRALSDRLSGGALPRRVVLLDSRAELYAPAFFSPDALLDVLREYPREEAILQAIKSLSPEALVCDEIGGMREAEALRLAVGCGVPLLCSAHGASLSSVLSRPPIALLREAGAFGAYIGIERTGDRFHYAVTLENQIAPSLKKESLC